MKELLTQAELKELLHYNPDTGALTWLKSGKGRKANGETKGLNNGYFTIRIKGRQYKSHRLAWLYVYGVWPKDQVDHINHITTDNRIANLREVTNQENHRNASLSKNNTSGVTGVYWHKQIKKWLASIHVDYKKTHLGCFDKFEDAIAARKKAENKYGFHENHGAS